MEFDHTALNRKFNDCFVKWRRSNSKQWDIGYVEAAGQSPDGVPGVSIAGEWYSVLTETEKPRSTANLVELDYFSLPSQYFVYNNLIFLLERRMRKSFQAGVSGNNYVVQAVEMDVLPRVSRFFEKDEIQYPYTSPQGNTLYSESTLITKNKRLFHLGSLLGVAGRNALKSTIPAKILYNVFKIPESWTIEPF